MLRVHIGRRAARRLLRESVMRRVALLALPLMLVGCTGFRTFQEHVFTLPGDNPDLPTADSETVRNVLGQATPVPPLLPEPGNVWPGPPPPQPTLQDIAGNPSQTTVPGETPGLPDSHQPVPAWRGSSTPPPSLVPGLTPAAPPPVSGAPPVRLPPGRLPGGAVPLSGSAPGIDSGGTRGYRTVTTPAGPGAIVVPNGNGTSTVIGPDGSVTTIPAR